MSVDNEEQFAMDQPVETNRECKKRSRISYTSEFLLSLSGLDICKKLPSGFDETLLREFEDASQDRQRISGDFSSHFRRNDYSSSPPTRGESGNYSRGITGRWDSRSSGRSERDSDSQSDRDSDSGRRYANPSRRPWQVPEHDGLLGKGSFPRPSGYASGTSGPKFQSNDHLQLSKSNEPYHPPRPYKALPHRRDTKDSYNDETFGSSDTSEDRAEEERKRRASFELLRREQHKAFQERQKLNPEGRKNDFDFAELLGDSKDEKVCSDRSNEADEAAILPGSHKSSLPSQNPASRPLVPPGFASTILEKKSGSITSAGSSQLEDSLLHAKGKHVLNGSLANQEEKQLGNKIGSNEQKSESNRDHISAAGTSEGTLSLSSVLGISSDATGKDNQVDKLSILLKATGGPNNVEVIEPAKEKLAHKKITGTSTQENAPSILDKLFNSAVTLNGAEDSSFIEDDSKGEDTWSPQTAKSSKFAHLFLEEEKKPVDGISSSRPNDLLSLIQGSDKSQASDVKATDQLSSTFPFQCHDAENLDKLSNISTNKPESGPPVLTCEDLEQSILSQVKEVPPSHSSVQDWNIFGTRTEQQKSDVDNRASQHLLSLLQKGAGPRDTGPPPSAEVRPSEKPLKNGASKEADAGTSVNSGKTLTLEALFGTAFMNELQSVGEPVSGKAEASEALEMPPHVKDDHLLQFVSSQGGQINSNGLSDTLFGFDDCRIDGDVSHSRAEFDSQPGGFRRSAGASLPGEDSLLTLGDTENLQNFLPFRGSHKQEPEAPVDITEKLAALNSVLRNERPAIGVQDGSFLRHPQYMKEPDISFQHSNNVPSSPPQLRSPQLNNAGPVFHSFDSHNANLKSFMAPGNIVHHDPSPNHQLPPNMIRPPFPHHGSGIADFDRLPHSMLQQMHVPGNLPLPHLLQGFPSGPARPPHLNNQLTTQFPEMNARAGFPFGNRPPNYAVHGNPPVPDIGRSDHPASLQMLLGMDPRVDPKRIPPFSAAAPHHQGTYSHELDLGFGYR